MLGVHLTPHDAIPGDDHAELELPSQPTLPVTVYSNEPELLRPVFAATPRVTAVYRTPEEYRPNDTGLVILDRFIPPQRPAGRFHLDRSAGQGSPIPVRTTVEQTSFSHWDTEHPGAAGLHTKDFKLDHATVFEAGASDGRIGEVAAGPVIVARPGKPKIVVLGFHPVLSGDALRTGHAAFVRQPAALDFARDFPPLGDLRRQRGHGQADAWTRTPPRRM